MAVPFCVELAILVSFDRRSGHDLVVSWRFVFFGRASYRVALHLGQCHTEFRSQFIEWLVLDSESVVVSLQADMLFTGDPPYWVLDSSVFGRHQASSCWHDYEVHLLIAPGYRDDGSTKTSPHLRRGQDSRNTALVRASSPFSAIMA